MKKVIKIAVVVVGLACAFGSIVVSAQDGAPPALCAPGHKCK